MYISAFAHRDRFFDITQRWLSSRLHPNDPMQITRILHYDGFIAWQTLLQFIPRLLDPLCPSPIYARPIHLKRDLKDFICNGAATNASGRIRELIANYRTMPEYYYVGAPISGRLFHDRHNRPICFCRLKRVRRIAEKAARYVSMHIFKDVKQEAAGLSPQGLRRGRLPAALLAAAEQRIMRGIRTEGIRLPIQAITLKDVLGMKVIDTGFGETGIERTIDAMEGVTIVEKERHEGHYNAVHYVVELTIAPERLDQAFSRIAEHSIFVESGLPETRITEDFHAFLASGLDTVQTDLILTSLDELIESEIGRSMHELRVFRQRRQLSYYGNIPINIGYILEYMLAVGISPAVAIDEIPIKIWGRYLPDTIDHHIRQLYGLPIETPVVV